MISLYERYPTDYMECLLLQRHLNELRNEDRIGDIIIATEHEDTYTGGIHFKTENITNYSVPIIKVERGGSLTYHGSGQLILYFIISLKERAINVKQLIEIVQNSVKHLLDSYGLIGEGRLLKETGVWVGGRKIGSIGFAVKGSSTLHGIAINVNTDLTKFYKINPCDFDPSVMTSLKKELGEEVDIVKFKDELISNLSEGLKDTIVAREWSSINK